MNQKINSKTKASNTTESAKPVLSQQEMELIRETAQLTENLYVKMVYDKLAMDKILNLI